MENLPFYKEVCTSHTEIDEEIRATVLVDIRFPEKVQKEINIQAPICAIIRAAECKTSKLFEIAEMWLAYRNDKPNGEHCSYIKDIINQALCPLALVSFFLNPNSNKAMLKSADRSTINAFLMDRLNNVGLDQVYCYTQKQGFFQKLFDRKMKAMTFWNIATPDCEELAELAVKMLSIPSSNSQIERVFSNWSTIHTKLRNRLTADRSKKLIHMYYSYATRLEKSSVAKEKDHQQTPGTSTEQVNESVIHQVEDESDTESESEEEVPYNDTDDDTDEFEELLELAQNK